MSKKKTGMCSCCKKNSATQKVGNRGLCEECLQSNCPLCLAELTEKERVMMPVNAQNSMSEEDLQRNKIITWRPCKACFLKKLESNKVLELKRMTESFDFQISNQQCGRCKELNNSRDDLGRVNSRFCQSCRKAFGDDTAIRNITIREPRDIKERATVVFDRVAGFKRQE